MTKTTKKAIETKSNLGVAASKVSSNTLKMQFMRKTLLKLDAEERDRKKFKPKEEAAQELPKKNRIYPCVQAIDDDPNCSLGGVLTEERFTVLENLRFGRFSFKGQNPEVEKLMVYYECLRQGLEPPEEKPLSEVEKQVALMEEGELDEDDYEYETCGPRYR